MDENTHVLCNQPVEEDGTTFPCPGTYEVQIPAFFCLELIDGKPRLGFSTLGGDDDCMGGVVIHCTEYGHPAPRTLYRDLPEVIHALEKKVEDGLWT